MRKTPLLTLLGLLLLVGLVLPATAFAERPQRGAIFTANDTVHPGLQVRQGTLPVISGSAARSGSFRVFRSVMSHEPVVGETRNWLALDDYYGFYYRKTFTLKAIRNNVEIWVASELNRRAPAALALPQVGQSSELKFLDGDCRNIDGVRTVVTDPQANYLADEFQNNILPKESVAFSVAPIRSGSDALLGAPFHPAGPGQRTVVLVDNVRDDNFYDFNNTQGFSYIAGFFSSQLNDLFDRNVMTIDGFDWLHRTHANPDNNPVPGSNCFSAPARPFLYEGVFAHEYQHLLESYEDSDEFNWINEGLSDWAQTLTGYATPSKSINDVGFDSHVQCFLGWLGVATPANPNPRAGGPENSLTIWGDQGDGEILCDYGAAYTMMEMLAGRYGNSFMSALHRGDANGFAGLQEALNATGQKKALAMDVFHDWTLMVALDGLIDDGARILGNWREKDFSTPTLHATINWATPEAYSTAGAPPNGSDYVRLRNAAGAYLSGRQIDSLSFQGSTTLPTRAVQWTVDPNPPLGHTLNPALYSGAANNRDEAIVKEINVNAPNLTFDALWNEELGWDFGFVQISTDGGATYKSLACTDTTTTTDPGALPTAKDNVPGFTGYPGAWMPQTCSLSGYTGTVLLAFRAFNDPSVLGDSLAIPPGFWVDNVRIGTTLVSDGNDLATWRSFTQVRPNTVAGFTVSIISINGNKITVKRLPLMANFAVSGNANVQKYIDKNADFVGAVVTYDDPTETSTQYAPYRLAVNGVVQPGGGT